MGLLFADTGTPFSVVENEEENNPCYEKRLSTSRYEFRRLAFNEAPLPSQGSDSTRGVGDLDPGGGQSCKEEKPDAEIRTQRLDIPIPASAKKTPDREANAGVFSQTPVLDVVSPRGRGKEALLLREASFDF